MLACAVAALAAAPPSALAQDVPNVPNALGCDFLDPSVCLLPWPNDYFTKEADTPTGRQLNLQVTAMPRNVAGKPIDPTEYNRADGFSPGQAIVTKVPGLDNTQAVENTGIVPIDDLARTYDPDQPVVVIDAATGERQLIWAEIDWNAGCEPSQKPPGGPCDPAKSALIIRPAKNWLEGHRYIVALRNLKDAQGNTIEAQPAFRAYRDGGASPLEAALDPSFEARRPQMEELFQTLGAAGIPRDNLYLAWDFTIASAESLAGRMLHIRDQSFAELGDTNLADLEPQGDAPAFTVSSVTNYPTGDIARQISGTYTVPCWMDKPGCPPAANRFLLGPDGKPIRIPGNTVKSNFVCRIPRWALNADGTLREQTRASLYGHGLFGSASGEIGAGNIGRFGNAHGISFCATDWMGMATTDIPNALTILADVSNFPTLADRVQQGVLNFLFLGRLMRHPDGFVSDPAFHFPTGDGGTQAAFDHSALFYDGNSQGGIIAGALTAVAVDHQQAVMGVPGMNYSTLLQRSVDFVGKEDPQQIVDGIENRDPEAGLDYIGYSAPMYKAYPDGPERSLIFSMIQMLWDRAEANGYAQHMTADPYPNTPSHEVLLHVAFGDHQVAPVTAEVEARTIGAKVLRKGMVAPGAYWGMGDDQLFYDIPAFESFPGDGSALVFWDSGTPAPPEANYPPRPEWGFGNDPHAHPRDTVPARIMKSEFMKVDGQVVDSCNGAPCYIRDYNGGERIR